MALAVSKPTEPICVTLVNLRRKKAKQDKLLYGEGGLRYQVSGFTHKIADAFLRSIEGLLFARDNDLVESLELCILVGLGRHLHLVFS
jgi:hypothetical protein